MYGLDELIERAREKEKTQKLKEILDKLPEEVRSKILNYVRFEQLVRTFCVTEEGDVEDITDYEVETAAFDECTRIERKIVGEIATGRIPFEVFVNKIAPKLEPEDAKFLFRYFVEKPENLYEKPKGAIVYEDDRIIISKYMYYDESWYTYHVYEKLKLPFGTYYKLIDFFAEDYTPDNILSLLPEEDRERILKIRERRRRIEEERRREREYVVQNFAGEVADKVINSYLESVRRFLPRDSTVEFNVKCRSRTNTAVEYIVTARFTKYVPDNIFYETIKALKKEGFRFNRKRKEWRMFVRLELHQGEDRVEVHVKVNNEVRARYWW